MKPNSGIGYCDQISFGRREWGKPLHIRFEPICLNKSVTGYIWWCSEYRSFYPSISALCVDIASKIIYSAIFICCSRVQHALHYKKKYQVNSFWQASKYATSWLFVILSGELAWTSAPTVDVSKVCWRIFECKRVSWHYAGKNKEAVNRVSIHMHQRWQQENNLSWKYQVANRANNTKWNSASIFPWAVTRPSCGWFLDHNFTNLPWVDTPLLY